MSLLTQKLEQELQARNDYVIVVRSRDSVSEGGIALPQSDKWESTMKGQVVSIGIMVDSCKVGDLIVFRNGVSYGRDVLMVKSEDVMAVIK